MKIQHEDLEGKSAFHFCRRLLHTLTSVEEELQVYRGDTLAYTVTSIKWGSTHVLTERSKGGFRIEKYRPRFI